MMAVSPVEARSVAQVLPAFFDSSRMRLFLGTALYLAQGLPQGILFTGIPAWLAANGQSVATVGAVIAAVSLPWSFKFFLGVVVDRYAYLAMGRRRGWLVGAQFGIIANMVAFGLVKPEAHQMALVLGFAFVMSLLTATQDVALDAMVVDLTPELEMGNVNGFMLGGKIIGIAVGGAATGYFAEYYGLDQALFVIAAVFVLPAGLALLVRERRGERLMPWTHGAAASVNLNRTVTQWLPILKIALRSILRRDPLVVIFLTFTYAMYQAAIEAVFPVISSNALGWGEARFTALGGMASLIVAPLVILAGGRVIDPVGPRRIAVAASLMSMAILVGFVAVAASWANETLFSGVYLVNYIAAEIAYLTMLVLMMRVCNPAVAATTFTLITSAHALGQSASGALTGVIENIGGLPGILMFAAAMIAISGLSSVFLSAKAGGSVTERPALILEPDGGGLPSV